MRLSVAIRPMIFTAYLAVMMGACWGAEAVAPAPESSPQASVVLPPLPAGAEAKLSGDRTTIPEPVSLAVFGTGLLLLLRRRRF